MDWKKRDIRHAAKSGRNGVYVGGGVSDTLIDYAITNGFNVLFLQHNCSFHDSDHRGYFVKSDKLKSTDPAQTMRNKRDAAARRDSVNFNASWKA